MKPQTHIQRRQRVNDIQLIVLAIIMIGAFVVMPLWAGFAHGRWDIALGVCGAFSVVAVVVGLITWSENWVRTGRWTWRR